MNTFVFFQKIVALVVITIQITGRLEVSTSKFLGCNNDGKVWIYTSIWGSLFALLHMGCICMQAVMIEHVFYSVPHHLGYFERDGFQRTEEL